VRGIDAMDRRVNRLAGLSDCLIYSSRPAVAEQQIEQLDAMANELTSMKKACLDYRSQIADAKPTPVDDVRICVITFQSELVLHLKKQLAKMTTW